MVRAVTVAVIFLLTACPARAEEPPPDPARGESYDGRPHEPGWRQDLLDVPRLLLLPVRLVASGIGWGVHKLLDWDEIHKFHETLLGSFSSRDGLIGVRPTFQYSISFAPIIGLRFFDQRLLGRTTDVEVTAMTGGLGVVYGELYLRPTPADRALQTSIRVTYNRRDDMVFTGIDLATADKYRITRVARYGIDSLDAGGLLTLALARGVFIDAATGFGLRRFNDGVQVGNEQPIDDVYCIRSLSGLCIQGTVDPLLVPGFNRGTQFFRAGFNLRVDSRDNWYQPASGALLELGADWSHGLGFDDSNYLRLHAGLSAALDLWKRSRTLVIRIEVNDLEPFGFYPVPFTELIVMGGPDNFRGFRPGRFRFDSSLLAAAEYRWPIWMWMDATLFAEYGGVFGPHFEGFSLVRMVPDVGAGVRMRSSDSFFVRAQVAYGWGDGWQLFVSVNTGF